MASLCTLQVLERLIVACGGVCCLNLGRRQPPAEDGVPTNPIRKNLRHLQTCVASMTTRGPRNFKDGHKETVVLQMRCRTPVDTTTQGLLCIQYDYLNVPMDEIKRSGRIQFCIPSVMTRMGIGEAQSVTASWNRTFANVFIQGIHDKPMPMKVSLKTERPVSKPEKGRIQNLYITTKVKVTASFTFDNEIQGIRGILATMLLNLDHWPERLSVPQVDLSHEEYDMLHTGMGDRVAGRIKLTARMSMHSPREFTFLLLD